MTSALAVLCIRNEAIHLRRCLTDLTASGLEVAIIDNASNDGSIEIAEGFLDRGVLSIEPLPWSGAFSLSDQLRAKQRVIEACRHDWVVHVDADEWLHSPVDGQTLLEGIGEADAADANCINFHEIVFVPLPGEDFVAPDYAQRMRTYYFFQPHYPRLNRAWKRTAGLDNLASGGHALANSSVRSFERDFILRHYIALSEEHARQKYLGRVFSHEDLSKGWHGNRTIITADNLSVRPRPELKLLARAEDRTFDLSAPLDKHFWQW